MQYSSMQAEITSAACMWHSCGTMRSSKPTVALLLILFSAAVSEGESVPEWSLYPFGQAEGDWRLDNVSSPAIILRSPFVFYHRNQSTIFVSLIQLATTYSNVFIGCRTQSQAVRVVQVQLKSTYIMSNRNTYNCNKMYIEISEQQRVRKEGRDDSIEHFNIQPPYRHFFHN